MSEELSNSPFVNGLAKATTFISNFTVKVALGLTALFVALKLIGAMTAEWVWVLSPLWLGAFIFIFVLCMFANILMINKKFKNWKNKGNTTVDS